MGFLPQDLGLNVGSLTVNSKSPKVRLQGTVRTDMPELTVKPEQFEGSSIELFLKLDTIYFAYRRYKANIFLITNNGNYEIPVIFEIAINWSSIIISTFYKFVLIISVGILFSPTITSFSINISLLALILFGTILLFEFFNETNGKR